MKKLAALFGSLSYLLLTNSVFADPPAPAPPASQKVQITPPPGLNTFGNLQSLLSNATLIVFILASLLVLAMLLWGGIEWILSAGDKEKVGNARKRILNAIIGLVILALAFLIVTIVGQLIGFNLTQQFTLPTPNTAPPPP